ncbi:MAG: fimbrial assembly protein [Terracidiphilus sp.]
MRVTLNLATRPFTDLGPAMKRLRIAMGVLTAVSLLLLLGLHELHNKAEAARAREHSLDGAIARITGERQGYQATMRLPENARFMSQVTMLNQLFGQKAFSWTMAMENLETVLPGGVQVTQIEPVRAKTGQTTVHLRVVGPHDLSIDLVRNLERSTRFMSPRIVGENAESNNSGPNARLEPVSASNRFEFDLLADYNPPTPEERKGPRRAEKGEAGGGDETVNRPVSARQAPKFSQGTGRPPYTGPATAAPEQPRPNPATYPHPAQGGPQ